MITKFATVVYCILVARLGEGITINSNCGEIRDGKIDKYCNRAGYANWFIVLDASFNSRTHYYNVQSQLATDVERWLNEQDDPDLDDKFHVCVILATNQVQVMRELCGNVSRRLPDVLTSTSPNMLMANVLREIEKQSVECDPNNVTQRIVLYIGQTALDLTSDEADKILIRWKEEYYSSIRSTQVHFFVLSNASGNPPDYYEKFLNYWDLIRGHLQLDPESRDFKDVRENLAKHAVQCACKMSEDCKIGNGTVAKPCHFNIVDGKEQCSMMINAKVKSKPMHARRLEKPLLACTELTYRNLGCGRDICMKDCDKKGWSSWSACDIHGNKSRIRLDRTDSYSKFTESCPKTVTVPCVLTSTATSTTTTTLPSTIPTTTKVVQNSIPFSTWALIVSLLILSCSIIAAVIVFVSVTRRRRRQRRFVDVHHKDGRGRRRDEPASAASTATDSRAASRRDVSMSRGPSSTWGRGSVSFANVDDSQQPKRRQDERQRPKLRRKSASTKIAKNDGRTSKSRPDLKISKSMRSAHRPRNTSMQVNLSEHQRPSDKKSASSNVKK